MEPDTDELRPDPSLSKDEMKKLQERIGSLARFSDDPDFDRKDLEELYIAGIDQAFTDEKAVSAVVVMLGGEVVEKVHAVEELEMPYIPGLLAFREAPAIISALEKLETKPDLLVLDGSGRIHYRQAGIATHIGIMYDLPAIGVAKNLLCGEPRSSVDSLREGEKVPIYSDERMNIGNELIGYAFQSRQYPGSTEINPLYVSPGHRVSADTAVEIIEELGGDYKLPEPTRLADSYVDEVKESI